MFHTTRMIGTKDMVKFLFPE
ncbi:hypothetical protein DSM3645_03798 [Blastopirellula marina DSM 3645]|uniref:Uncharacterized protein n=1 Tax=Blastopirellula marina DSM 3645 TaxID=314230 RepID=A3ZW71_9BACT|nr:hypothetical protein DSM3645_03798 [Blastopirellula marina DSM 3645]